MPAATRIGDGEVGTCDVGAKDCPHTRSGTNSTASGNVFINGRGAHRLGDTGPCNCPHGGTFATTGGSGSVFINGQAATRIGDATTCQSCGKGGQHVAGSGNVFIGG